MSRLARVELGLEARAHREDHLDTRMWLRLLACISSCPGSRGLRKGRRSLFS